MPVRVRIVLFKPRFCLYKKIRFSFVSSFLCVARESLPPKKKKNEYYRCGTGTGILMISGGSGCGWVLKIMIPVSTGY